MVRITSPTFNVPSSATVRFDPGLTPPMTELVAANKLMVPEDVMALPVAGDPSPMPEVTEVTVPLLVVVRYPLGEIANPVLGMITPGEVVVATGKPTPLNVWLGANTMEPVIVPPASGNATSAVACAVVTRSLTVLTAALVAACVVDGEVTELERTVMPNALVEATLFAKPCGVTAMTLEEPAMVSAFVARRTWPTAVVVPEGAFTRPPGPETKVEPTTMPPSAVVVAWLRDSVTPPETPPPERPVPEKTPVTVPVPLGKTAEIVPSAAMKMLPPALTPPMADPVGGRSAIVPDELMVPPVRPVPAVIAVTVPPAPEATRISPSIETVRLGPKDRNPLEYLMFQDGGEEKADIYYGAALSGFTLGGGMRKIEALNEDA